MTLEAVESILKNHAADFVRAYVYGSVADGTQDEHSDVDLILIRETDRPFFDRIREVSPLVREMGSVDLMICTPAGQREVLGEPGRE